MNFQLRIFLVCLALMAAPLVPIWVAGGREGTVPIVAVMSPLLFIGAATVGWELIQREVGKRDSDES